MIRAILVPVLLPFVGLSVSLNEWTGGPAGYSLCARFWEGRLERSGLINRILVSLIDAAMTAIESNHCREAWLRRTLDRQGGLERVKGIEPSS